MFCSTACTQSVLQNVWSGLRHDTLPTPHTFRLKSVSVRGSLIHLGGKRQHVADPALTLH
ncbi:hypothetical protein ABLA30_00420 [Xenorhabdus nematophila]|uniref:hypothetical protein n=1 Tax=Xenorhabdus nematophila TaxID=628 RepID=UPI0032B74F84